MKRKIKEKLKAIALRKKGHSINEIVDRLKMSKSTISLWIRNVELSPAAQKLLMKKIQMGQMRGAQSRRDSTKRKMNEYRILAAKEISTVQITKSLNKIICSLLYWCEGAKSNLKGVNFTNSDPKLIKKFICLLRNTYKIDEKKFRISMHLHEYHSVKKQSLFWSKITNIPISQIIKPYIKPHTGKRIRQNYPGCITVRYHSNDLAKELLSTAEEFLKI